MSAVESFIPVNGNAGNSAPFGGRRRSHGKKLRLVKKKTVRRMLAKLGQKMRGGTGSDSVVVTPAAEEVVKGGRRHSKKQTRRHRRSLFGLKY